MHPEAEWEGTWLGRPEVVKTEDGWVMLYEGGGNSLTGLATSTDGMTWERYADAPIFTVENSVNNYKFYQAELHHHDDLFSYYLEAGNGALHTDVYLWTFASPFAE